jgi:hypothetical protein
MNGTKDGGIAADDAAASTGEFVTAAWSWPALAAFLVPGLAFAIVWFVG